MNSGIHIAPVTAMDVDRLLPLVQQYWRFEAIEGFDPLKVGTLLRGVVSDPALGQAWVATRDGHSAGYLLAVFVFSLEHGGLTAEIDEFYVTADHRGQGVGARLLEVAEHAFRMRGCTNVSLQVGRDNEEARAFYHARGFRHRDGFDLVDKNLE